MGFFKAYDMRGTFGADFDLDLVYRVGCALPQVVPGKRWLIGRDCRVTSDAVRDALVAGLVASGAQVSDLGRCTTPMVYYFTAADNYDGSVMITASHNPPTDNGLKVSMKTALPVGFANGLNRVQELCEGVLLAKSRGTEESKRVVQVPDALPRYIAWMRQQNPYSPPAPGTKHQAPSTAPKALNYAVDCSNGMASLLAHELFPGAVFLNDTPDGTFPNHSPNPLMASAREQIAQVVRERHLDCGVIFDGDADRAMFVDENGDFIQPDYLIPIIAQVTETLSRENDNPACGKPNWESEFSTRGEKEKRKIIHDVRTSRGAIETLREMGCEPVMVPVGHAFAKPILREINALCGGELAGHYYFSEFFGCDSGVLAAMRVLTAVADAKAKGQTFSEMMRPIVSRYANSGEINFKVEDKEAAIARALAAAAAHLPAETGRSTLDGLRLEYKEGWINIRQSNTEPYLRLIVEADTTDRLAQWTGLLSQAIEGKQT